MKIAVYIATSANGYISNSRNAPDWLSSQYGQGLFEICQRKRAVIMGRITYEILAPDHLPVKEGTSVVLTARQNLQPANPTVVFTDARPGEIVAMLETRGHSEAVIIGGTATISEFMNAGLVNELFIVVEPVLFGGKALPLIQDVARDFKLSLIDTAKLNDHTVRLHYQIAG